MTSFWAGPSCTHVLAQLGAEVIHVESTSRPDGTRLDRGRTDHRRPVVGALSDLLGPEHQQEERDARYPQPTWRRAAPPADKTCDVIVENYTPGVLDQIGLDFDTVHRLRPDAS